MSTRNRELPGRMLRLERIRQGKGQKEVCYGICVNSYLSKIEHGQVCPDGALLEALYERLGIRYENSEEFLWKCREQIEKYFENQLYVLDNTETFRELSEQAEKLSYSELVIDWLLIQGLEGLQQEQVKTVSLIVEQLAILEDCMEERQKAYYYLLRAEIEPDRDLAVKYGQKAVALCENSLSLIHLCYLYLYQDNYSSIHQMEQHLVAIALAEGNTYQLADYYFLKGSAYARLDMDELMMSNYLRGIRLLQNTQWKGELAGMYYNIGATYVKRGRYEEAMHYLEMAEESGTSFFILHKKALACVRSGRIPEGKEYLRQMKELLDQEAETDPEKVSRADHLRWEEACMECQPDFLDQPEYLVLMEELTEELERDYHFGHLFFYRDLIVECYKRQRKYKKALEFEQKISEVTMEKRH